MAARCSSIGDFPFHKIHTTVNTIDTSKLSISTASAPKSFVGSLWRSSMFPGSVYLLVQDCGKHTDTYQACNLRTGSVWDVPKATPEEAVHDLEFVAEDVTVTLALASARKLRWFLPPWSSLLADRPFNTACFYEFNGETGTYFFRTHKGGVNTEESAYSLGDAAHFVEKTSWKEVFERPSLTPGKPVEPKTRWFVDSDYEPGDCFWEFVGNVGTFFAANGEYTEPAGPSLSDLEDPKSYREVFERPTFEAEKDDSAPKTEPALKTEPAPKTRWFVPTHLATGCFWEFVGAEGTFFYSSGGSTSSGMRLEELESDTTKYREVFERPTTTPKTEGPTAKTRWFVPPPDRADSARWRDIAFIEFVGDVGTWYNKDGSTQASSFSLDLFRVFAKGWVEVTERPKIESPKSRFFQHVTGFGDSTLYVEVRSDGTSAAVVPDEAPEYDGLFSLDSCLNAVDRGLWREIQVRRFRDIGPESHRAGPHENPVDFVEFIDDRPGISVYRDGTRNTGKSGSWGSIDWFKSCWVNRGDPQFVEV